MAEENLELQSAVLHQVRSQLWYQIEKAATNLSVKWADRNIGAEQCSDAGDFFAWGEINPKTKFYNAESFERLKLIPYNRSILQLSLENDAAFQILGEGWRLPTRDEAIELIENCDSEIARINDVYGTKVIGPNSNSIFLPNTGRVVEEDLLDDRRLYYWLSTSYGDADGLGGDRGDLRWYFSYKKHIGRCIRPVYDRE